MMTRRRFLSALVPLLAVPLVVRPLQAQGPPGEPQRPVGVADNAELTQRVTVCELRDQGILAVLAMQAKEMQKIRNKQGNPGPHAERLKNT
jgi:hypothetical protein